MNNQKVFGIVMVGLVFGLVGMSFLNKEPVGAVPDGKYDTFAQCLTERGATFYGTFWCPHCADQKEMFGSAIKYVNYVECSTADGRGQLPVCAEAGIEGYPTWRFADGSEFSGAVPLERLAEKTGCALPVDDLSVEEQQ